MMLRTIISLCCFVAMICAIICALLIAGATDHVIKYNSKLIGELAKRPAAFECVIKQLDTVSNEKESILNRARDMRVELLELRKANKSSIKQVNYLMDQIDGYTQKIEALMRELENK
jgi:hypothetical protein